jgi:hypothetical protein
VGDRDLVSFLESAPGATIFHLPPWNRIVAEVFSTDFSYLVALQNGVMVGVMPCHLVARRVDGDVCYSPPRVFESPYGGPVATGRNAVEVARRLVHEAAQLGHRSNVHIFSSPENSDWVGPSGFSASQLETACVDLRPELERIWAESLDSKRRNMIRKAEKSGVEVRSCGVDELMEYVDLVGETVDRGGFACQPAVYYAQVLKAFAPSDTARLYIARREGQALAGGIFLRQGAHCYYWHGATARGVGSFGQGEIIQWEVIKWAKAAGCEWYDLVGVERERLPNIALFKLGFTKQIVPFYYVHHQRVVDRAVLKLQRTVRSWVR